MFYIKVWLIIFSIFLMTLDKLSFLGKVRDSVAIYVHKQVFLFNYRVQNYPKLIFLQKSQENTLAQENIQLRKKIEQYAILLKQQNNQDADNKLLQQISDKTKLFPHFKVSIAKAVIDINYVLKNQILINIGTNSGVKVGDAVMNETGLVGQVVVANGDNSQVSLITNSNSTIFLQDSISKVKMLARGSKDNLSLVINEINKSDQVAVGDILTTTGLDDIYPANLAVAKVVKIINKDNGFNSAICEPIVDFKNLQYIVVLNNANK